LLTIAVTADSTLFEILELKLVATG
jgi:hypothetical protein